jgi:CBS domain containing-hemolysin-like protein
VAGFLRRRREPAPPAEPDRHEREILAALERLRETSVREVMTPRVDVMALPVPVDADDVSRAVKESGHSRFPVYAGDLDHLVGVLFVKDLFRMSDAPTPDAIARRLRPPFVVPESRRVLDVLSEMRLGRNAFAVVVDEHGGIEGVLTVKDLVSELVGDLRDEFDRPEDDVLTRVDATRWLAEGACPLDRLAELTGLELPDGEYVTLGGFLLDRFGRIPGEGDRLDHDGWELRVAEMDRRRIAKVVVRSPSGTIDATGK